MLCVICVGSAVKSLTNAGASDGSGRGQYALYVSGDDNYSALGRGTSLKQIMDIVSTCSLTSFN